jgi:hypothetical protein
MHWEKVVAFVPGKRKSKRGCRSAVALVWFVIADSAVRRALVRTTYDVRSECDG